MGKYKNSLNEIVNELKIDKGNFLITGATGLIGSSIIDLLLAANEKGSKFTIFAMSRSMEKIKKRFGNSVIPIVQDITESIDNVNKYDYIIHCASNADPKSYVVFPVETILTNIVGSRNILEYCKKHTFTRLVFTSTFEVYGLIDGVSVYKENMSGIIDQTVLRNGYPESKRSCELLLRSYVNEYGINAVIVRLPSVYGPTMTETDTKAHAQFIRNAINNEDIVLKSAGTQKRTYCYVLDAVRGIFKVLLDGIKGEIYNISNENSIVSIADVAKMCAKIAGTKVVFDIAEEQEQKGYSYPMDCILDNTKLKKTGWNAKFSLEQGMYETITELSNTRSE